ncbi:SRPBCC domain-containing protein [Longispora sp. K20-0274]|uniref:SRPBCC domain-containing protein n=1 Tax=Longispora sp. K20-0274 TaxID=3088255 RepID=UPI00399B60C0
MTSTQHELYRREIAAGEARCAVFRRTYDAPIEDVWDACTDPERLRRWYAPVKGDLTLGGEFTQGDFGPGRVTRCEAPRLLTVALGGGDPAPDEIELRLTANPDGGTTLEFEHATTIDTHEINGQIFDAVYCMGGGYGPRLVTLDQHLRGELPGDLDASALHMMAEYGPAIQSSMAALADLIEADKNR